LRYHRCDGRGRIADDGKRPGHRRFEFRRRVRLGRDVGPVVRHLPGQPGPRRVRHELARSFPGLELAPDQGQGAGAGAYHFLDPGLDGAAQASYFVETVSQVGLLTTDMLWLDNETAG
jgi:hypothetical protein